MPMMRQVFTSFADMPDGLRTFLFSENFNGAENLLQQTYKFTDDQKIIIGDQMMDAVFGDKELGEAVVAIKQELVPKTLTEEKWKEFLADILKVEAWPLRDLFGSELTRVMEENGLSTAGWPPSKIYLRPMTYSAAASDVAAMAGFTLMSPQARERLRDLIMTKAKGVRIDAQVKEVLVRPNDFGGLGLDSNTADKTVKTINELIAGVKVMSEEEYADWLSEEARKKTEEEARAKKAAEVAPTTEEEIEIAKIKASMPAKPATVLDEAVEKIYAGLTFKPTDEYLVNRLRHIISSRLRDVRSSLEVVQLLQRDTKVGGVGLNADQARDIGGQIETAYQSTHDTILADEKKKIETQMQEQKVKIEERKRREAEEHAKWYQDKIQVRKQEDDQKKLMAEQMKQSFMAGGMAKPAAALPMDIKEAQKEKERFGEMVPAVAAGAAPIAGPKAPDAGQAAPTAQSASPAKPAAAGAAPGPFTATQAPTQAARPEVKVSKETIIKQPLAPGLKPRMDDVKFASPRLMGLVDELKQVTLSEFRRLAKDPEGAAQKIMQKLDTLGGESFEKRVQGIQAWQESPMQKSYLDLVSESFRTGKSVQEVAETKRAAGQDAPSPAEVSAVITLNSKLHF
ncbi:MAG: hypothetical protein WC551_01480 [Patescibacteria group bacterium]